MPRMAGLFIFFVHDERAGGRALTLPGLWPGGPSPLKGEGCWRATPRAEGNMSEERDQDPILTGRNGKLQRRRGRRRRLFGKKAKAAFLESFACTANAAASAEAVGFAVGTVFTHRRTDAEFRELYWVAFEQALGKLVALRVQHEIERAEGTRSGDRGADGRASGRPADRRPRQADAGDAGFDPQSFG